MNAPEMTSLSGRVAVVTGAANGIGRSCALHLGSEGADLMLVDLDVGGLETLVAALAREGRRAVPIGGDCREDATLEQAFGAAEDRFGAVDILVNNVGQSARAGAGEFAESRPETWKFVLDVSLMTSMRFARRAAPAMRERGWGRIINMSSDAALAGDAGLADYAAAKSGLLGLTRALARELAPHGVTVNAVCPGAIRTRALEEMAPDVVARVTRGIPMGRVGEPEDVARLVTFLAGEGGRYITGQTLLVDGGRWML